MSFFKQWLDRSLGRRIGVLVSVLLLLVAGIVSSVSYFQVREVTREGAETRLRVVGRQLAELLGRGPTTAAAELARIAGDSGLSRALLHPGSPDTAAIGQILRKLLTTSPRSVFAVLDWTGATLVQVG
ncbi:MAG TPA: hypothetical protein VFU23_03365, partial [Gemmatimonadales bacterium]|nr:hypothetical protein [Gemmatimonadales bacterium]